MSNVQTNGICNPIAAATRSCSRAESSGKLRIMPLLFDNRRRELAESSARLPPSAYNGAASLAKGAVTEDTNPHACVIEHSRLLVAD